MVLGSKLRYQADIGVKDGKIVGIGKAGNPDMMDGVTDNMVFGSATEVWSLFCAMWKYR